MGCILVEGIATMLILFLTRLDRYWDGKLDELRANFPEHDFVAYDNSDNPAKLLAEADLVVKGSLTAGEVELAKNLKAVVVPWTGVDGLPLRELRHRSILVANNHGNARIVAERAFALALALTGRIVELHNSMVKGMWLGRPDGKNSQWFSILGKSCAVLGMGQIGQNIASFLKAFDCKVQGFKKHISENIEGIDLLTENLEEAIEGTNLIFVALPLTAETVGMISLEILQKMKGKYLINIARGKVIDEEALYETLVDGTLAGAAIDVWYNYPTKNMPFALPSKYPIHTLPNVVMSPHVGSWSDEGNSAMVDDTIRNIVSYIVGGEFIDNVDLDLSY